MNSQVCRSKTQLTSIHLRPPSQAVHQQTSKLDSNAGRAQYTGQSKHSIEWRAKGIATYPAGHGPLSWPLEALVVSSASPEMGISSLLFWLSERFDSIILWHLAVISTGLATSH